MTERNVAEGATPFRRVSWLERLAARLRPKVGPTIHGPLKRLYRGALRVRTGGRGVVCRLPGGEQLRVHPDRAPVWNPDEYRAFRAVVGPGAIALDVGANAGAYALVLGLWVGPRGHVYAFEPAPELFEILTEHVGLNDLASVVTPVRAAVDARVGTARFLLAGTAGESRLAGEVAGGSVGAIDVETTTIDAFCARERIAPDFIKVDVEGAELAVLRGARETIRARGGALALFVEMHPSIWERMGLTPDQMLAGIRELGLEPTRAWEDVLAVEGLSVRLSCVF